MGTVDRIGEDTEDMDDQVMKHSSKDNNANAFVISSCMSPSVCSSSSSLLSGRISPATTTTTTASTRAPSSTLSPIPQHQQQRCGRHEEQDDEAFYDDRSDADDDLVKGTIKFPQNKLYGRDEELSELEAIVRRRCGTVDPGSEFSPRDVPQKVVWVSGPSGVGKSALVDQLETRLERMKQPFWMCRGKFNPTIIMQTSQQREPFSALQQLLTELQERDDVSWKDEAAEDEDENDEIKDQHDTRVGLLPTVPDELSSCHSHTTSHSSEESTKETVAQHHRSAQHSFWKSSDASLLLDVFPVLHKLRRKADGCSSPCSISNRTSHSTASTINDDEDGSANDAKPAATATTTTTTTTIIQSKIPVDLSQIGRALAAFFSVYCHPKRSLILYLDDLQWADVASLEVLEAIFLHHEPRNHLPVLWICCYRNEELDSAPRLRQLLDTVQEKQADKTTTLTLSTLAPRYIARFLRDTLDLVDVDPLMQLIYSKTLGNILFCRQAVEEMVRNNILYYDVVCFQWTYVLPETESTFGDDSTVRRSAGSSPKTGKKEPFLWSKSAVEMVQQKLELLPLKQKRALIVAAYIRNILDVTVLLSCLCADAYAEMDRDELVRLLDDSVEQGLLLKKTRQQSDFITKKQLVGKKEVEKSYYVFTHERVQEAAYTLISPGETRHMLLVQIAQTLLDLVFCDFSADITTSTGSDQQKVQRLDKQTEWMLYVAAEHLNRVPSEYWTDPVLVAQLNLRVGKISMAKASFDQAVQLLRSGVAAIYSLPGSERVDRPTLTNHRRKQWEQYYQLLLSLTNHLIEAESAQGNYAEGKAAVEECLANAKSDKDKSVAYFTKVDLAVRQNKGKMFHKGIEESIMILRQIGVRITEHPTKADLLGEKMRLQISLGARSISAIADLPIAEEDWKMKLISQLCLLSNFNRNTDLTALVTLRALRMSLEDGVTKYHARMLASYGVPLRLDGQLQQAYSYAAIVNKLYKRFPTERGRGEFSMGQTILESSIVHVKKPFQDSLETMMSLYWMNVANGNVDMALSAAVHFPLLFFASGLPLNGLVEPKLILFQDKARQLRRPAHEAIFKATRQFLRNLQGKTYLVAIDSQRNDPTELKGDIMDENEILSNMEGNCHKMTLRDFSTLRLALACIFIDEMAMDAMIARLNSYPLFDLPMVREHLQLMYQGMAAFYVGRKKDDKKLLRLGQDIVKKFQKLANAGSPNAPPVLSCLRALDRRRKSLYDEAIAACSESGCIHMEALMYEHSGRAIIEQRGTLDEAREYLTNALWLWTDWGAFAKVDQLKKDFEFLQSVSRNTQRNSSMRSTVLHTATQLGMVDESSTQSGGFLKE